MPTNFWDFIQLDAPSTQFDEEPGKPHRLKEQNKNDNQCKITIIVNIHKHSEKFC